MKKSVFKIKDMDCSAEEELIRMQLAGVKGISFLQFNLPNRELVIFHTQKVDIIEKKLKDTKLGSKISDSTNFSGKVPQTQEKTDSKLLWIVLIINFSFFIIELISGIISNSLGLIADSLDMFSDAAVYGLSLYAVHRALSVKKKIARASGVIQLLLAIIGLSEVLRRFFFTQEVPNSTTMIVIAGFALLANVASLIILNKSKNQEVHITSSKIFTSNDIIANAGVIIAGILVIISNSRIPDLIVGTIVFLLVFRGAIRILNISR